MENNPREDIARSVLSIVLREILADGTLDAAEKATLNAICQQLKIPNELFQEVVAETKAKIQADPEAGTMDPQAAYAKVQEELAANYPPEYVRQVMHRLEIAFLNRSAENPIPYSEPEAAAPVKSPPTDPPARSAQQAVPASVPPPAAAPAPAPAPAPTRPLSPAEAAEAREQEFIRLVEESWERFDEVERTNWVDDAFIGNVIAAHVANGRFLLDITSDGVIHYMLFSSKDRTRYVVRLDHTRAEDFAFARSVGHLTTVTLGYSRAFPDVSKLMTAVKSELKSNMAGAGRIEGYEDPGVIKLNHEGTTATAETSLMLELGDYIDPRTLRCDRDKLWTHFGAVYQSLQKYLEGIMA